MLDELIEMYATHHGELPTNDAIRSWMTTLQEATATSTLASGVVADDGGDEHHGGHGEGGAHGGEEGAGGGGGGGGTFADT